MKTLMIVRHGKSDWEFHSVKDIDRTLKERGINDGYFVANKILKKGVIPEIIISSTANRAFHTALIFSRVLGIKSASIIADESLYLSDVDEILSVIYACDDSLDRVMIFGHNPGFTELTNYLSHLNISNLPTTGVATLVFDTDSWTEISKSKVINEDIEYPGRA
ncbi:MAG: histidine phosphatase family protein [Bacteroidales bacterium]|nr:histidine phosphatase family protein [Bacteroidales bacterium]MCF8391928.1 histidine phosphatase family protein [Bacteroidales bacterium]